ncbi:MAG: (d)CMP kinase [Clostridiales bacterium]|nr:(d)CMP kinase [Clostridiales bacterium]
MVGTKIAIDGPSGAGKSTISEIVAHKIGFTHIDTGATYRVIAYAISRFNVNLKNEKEIRFLLDSINIDIKFLEGKQFIYLNCEDVTDELRSPKISSLSSYISKFPFVRKKLTHMQRKIAEDKNVIMDGRDIGTKVFKNADLKIFLTASLDERAKRRYEELEKKEIKTNFEYVRKSMKERDTNDSKRSLSPLKPATDALIIDTTGNTLEKSVDTILKIVRDKLSELINNKK